MRRQTWMLLTLASVLLVAAVASAVPPEGRECDRACHARLRQACAEDPTVSDRCHGARADRHERMRAYCADHADEARCQPADRASDRATDRPSDASNERMRRHCADHPDDRRC